LEHQFLLSKYTLSEKEEKIINLTSKTAYSNWVDMMSELLDKQQLTVIDENLQKVKINYNDTNKYLDSQNKKVRDYASKEYNKVNTRYTEIAEFEINSILERKRTLEEYRGIKRPDFPRHMSDDIETEVVDTLIKTVTDNFEISKRYYTKKAQLLGIKQLGYHERNVLMPNADVKYTYEQAMHIVGDVFNGIDLIFFNLFSDFEKSGAYDVFPKQGKTGGAFCISMNKSLPIYILLNFKDKLSDILTIAHETGHAIHYKLSGEQNSINYAPPTSLAEIASTFFEDFALSKILEDTKDDNAKTAILDMKLHGDISTIFRQVAFYNFEKDLHHDFNEKGFLTKEYISDLFCKHMHSYLGDAVKEDESMRNGWIYISHFRRPFYVYSYASGLLISKALQQMVKEDKKNISYVKTFLESGSSKSPKDLFMGMGIDITKKEFWEKGLSSTKELVEKL
jgi:oligoendopeptidase F